MNNSLRARASRRDHHPYFCFAIALCVTPCNRPSKIFSSFCFSLYSSYPI